MKEYLDKFHKKFLDKESMIFDLGANLGDKTHIFLKFSKKVICYEPENKMFNILSHRFKTKRVVINKKIISATESKLKVIFCIGETSKQKRKKLTKKILLSQLSKGLKKVKNKKNCK